ncbi:hypothetical protein OV203_16530 [Nannocystis sp. ILAH1]|uniref:hypothetical protein n=1 Tax=unclassified Nannocystis TaxID=2627009 RepID=UPI00226F5A2F|nr:MULTISPECIES: hypothetical protein [unclassified Nannocystis]MCY0988743.1 hypothetical protein [Nannocystis sp. ILAH1]MCY1072519.1 hypothetical protein [Nannocystis sp. RBIL2]
MRFASRLVLTALLFSVAGEAAAVDNPECLGSACGRPTEQRAEEGFFASLWEEFLALFA